jgi:hypothetical protein
LYGVMYQAAVLRTPYGVRVLLEQVGRLTAR